MKDKTAAGILALFLGGMGFHQFYLGKTGKGIAHLIFCWFPLSWIIGIISGIIILSMDKRVFDAKYNYKYLQLYGKQGADTDFDRHEWDRPRRRDEPAPHRRNREAEIVPPPSSASRPNPHKQKGLEKFKDYDYYGAIEDFKKSLQLAPKDVATHFNLACAYSLTEDAEKSFQHLEQAAQCGFRDFQKIKEHQALAFLRIQNEFESFEKNGFRLPASARANEPAAAPDLLSTAPSLLDHLKKLGDLREQGLLTEQEFEEQKRKLLQ